MAQAHLNPVPQDKPIGVAIVSPNGKEAMQQHAEQQGFDWLMLAALVFATLVGLVAGILPANKAVKISALEAIRHE